MQVRRRLIHHRLCAVMFLLGLAFFQVGSDSAQAQSSGGWIGLKIAALAPESASARGFDSVHGVLVMAALPGGPAASGGLRSGDIITHLDGRRLAWYEALAGLVRSRAPEQTISVVYWRDGRERQTSVVLGERKAGLKRDLTEERAEADYNAAYEAFEAGNTAKALQLLRGLEGHGSPAGRALLGYLYDSGMGVAQNRTEAHRLYRLAAEHGNTWAQYSLGLQYRDGVAGPRDLQRAYYWLEKAARQDHPDAVTERDAIETKLSAAQRNGAEAWLAYVPEEPAPEEIAALDRAPSVALATPADRGSGAVSPASLSRDAVREIQELLARLGYAPGPADGAPGPRTRRAIEAFQRDRGLTVGGQPSAALLESLRTAAQMLPAASTGSDGDLGDLDDLSDF